MKQSRLIQTTLTIYQIMFTLLACDTTFAQASKSFSEGFSLMQQSLFEQASERFQQSIKEDSNYTSSYGKLGLCLEKLKNYDEAVQVWRVYGQKNPQVKAQIQTHIMLLGKMKDILPSLSKGDVRSVIGTVKEILKDPYPESAIALDCAAAIAHDYFSQKQYPQAYSAYSQIIGRYPTYLIDDIGLYEYANLLSMQDKNYLESAKFYKEIINRPHSGYSKDELTNLIAECYKNQAEEYEKSNKEDKDKLSRSMYERILLECPNSKHAEVAKGKVGDIVQSAGKLKESADLYFEVADYKSALPIYQQLVANSTDPNTVSHALFQTGQCISTEGKYQEAVKIFHEVVMEYPQSEWSDDSLVRAACLLGGLMNKPELAIKEWKILLDRYPNSPYADIAYFDTGRIYKEKLNNYRKAYQFFEKVIKDYPSSPWVELAKYKINEMKNAGK